MWIRDEVLAAAQALRVPTREIERQSIDALLSTIEDKYCQPGLGPFWARVHSGHSIEDSEALRLVAREVHSPVVLVVDDAQGRCGFEMANGDTLSLVISECSLFEFILTDWTTSFLIASNHHGVAVGAGTVVPLMKSIGGTARTLGEAGDGANPTRSEPG